MQGRQGGDAEKDPKAKGSEAIAIQPCFGIVIIGRNEGERLVACLQSAIAQVLFQSQPQSQSQSQPQSHPIVYVDSGSTDRSVAQAQALGVEVVVLNMAEPFTAARARNLGLKRLLELYPISYVQFVDGDCALNPVWCQTALASLQEHPKAAVVCGRRRERFPEASVFNMLCDLEWNTPIGEAIACGGDALIRVAALQQVGGYHPHLIAGEEPELCLRLRHQGWQILRINAEMTLHDAQMMRFGQWWTRAVRGGHAYAEVSWLHRHDPERFWQRECFRILTWGLGLPLLSLVLCPFTHGWSLGLWLLYPLLAGKIFRQKRDHDGSKAALYYALFCTLVKFPELQGLLVFHFHRLRGDRSVLIEYKGAASPNETV